MQSLMDSCFREPQQTKIANNNTNQQGRQEECFSYAMQLITSTALPVVLNAVVQLGVLEILAKAGPDAELSPSEIVSQLHTKNPDAETVLDRMLRLLASHSVLTCSGIVGRRVYGLAPVAKFLVENRHGSSLAPLLGCTQDKVIMDTWYGLRVAVVEGGTAFERTHDDEKLFSYIAKDPRFSDAFNKGMSGHTIMVLEKLLEFYKGFENLNSLVDVGGSLGHAIAMITSKYPNIKGINFDLPHVVEHAPSYPGVEHKGGDMFQSVPKADAVFMKWILHDWDDENCLKLLKNCYKALPNKGKVIAIESIVPVDNCTSATTKSTVQLDVFMMAVCSPSAKERSETEFVELATKAGFEGIRFQCPIYNLWVLEFYK